jgi:drug/metabolite transporter (DMT)-like permease
MMSIVVALLGAFHCGAAAALHHDGMVWGIALGAAFIVCGLVLVVMFGRAEGRPRLGWPILLVAILSAIIGVVAVMIVPGDPFSWMMCVLGAAIFIDALCLKISLSARN